MKTPEHIKDLTLDPQNARRHTPRNIGVIADSMHEAGFGRSILIDEDNVLIAGEGAVEAAGQVGITKLRIVDASGDEVIAVRRSNLSPAQKRRLALADNRANELSEWDADVLRAAAADGALDGLFDAKELTALLEDAGDAAPVDAVKVERPQEVAWILVGLPLERWPEHQHAIEALQEDAAVTTMVMRPKDGSAGTFYKERT